MGETPWPLPTWGWGGLGRMSAHSGCRSSLPWGGSGWKLLHRDQRGVRGLCPLGVRTGRSQPLAAPGHDLFKEMHNHGSSQWAVEGSQVFIKELPC